MRRFFSGRGGTVLAFLLGLLIATAGTAGAAKLITGKQIKDGSISARDLNKAVRAQLTKADLPGPPGAKGDTGAKGEAGATGQTGPRGFSAWDTIPSGVTVTGAESFDSEAPTAGADFTYTVRFPGVAPAPPISNFAADAYPATKDDDSACTGTFTAPTAPPGRFCAYMTLGGPSNVSSVEAQELSGLPNQGVRIAITAALINDVYFSFTWAYTAP